ncbi:MAG: glycosyltransferase family 39 protein [Chloroflexi bacterium]|nr:glycosyltransferase family 39 protein [Chloroflexota bacterium]
MKTQKRHGRQARNTIQDERHANAWQPDERIPRLTSHLSQYIPHTLALLAFLLRALNITGESLWRDEIDTVRFSFTALSEMLGNLARNGFNGPLYHLLMRAWLSLAGVNDFALRYFSLLCGVAEIVLVFALARRLFGRRTALLATWFAAIAPVLIWYSGEGKMYTLQPALIVLALYALRRAVESRPWRLKIAALRTGRYWRFSAPISNLQSLNPWWAVFIVAVSLGYYVHLLTPLFLAVAAAFFLLWWLQSRYHIKGALLAVVLCTLPYVPMAVWQLPTFLAGTNTGHTFYPLSVTLFSLLYNWSLGLSEQLPPGAPAGYTWLAILAFAGIAVIGLAGSAVTLGAPANSTPHSRQNAVVTKEHIAPMHAFSSAVGVFMWLMLPMCLVFVISTRAPVFEPRYVLWSAPALYILMGAGLAWLLTHVSAFARVLFVLVSMVSLWGTAAQMLYPIRPDVSGAARYVAAHMQPDDLFMFQIPYTRYGFEYYLPMYAPALPVDPEPRPDDGLRTLQGLRERIVDAPYTNHGATTDDVNSQLLPMMFRQQRIWLVEVEASMWDERDLVRAWYDENMQQVERRELRGVTVTLYEITWKTSCFLPHVSVGEATPER